MLYQVIKAYFPPVHEDIRLDVNLGGRRTCSWNKKTSANIVGLVQDCGNSIANLLEFLQSWT